MTACLVDDTIDGTAASFTRLEELANIAEAAVVPCVVNGVVSLLGVGALFLGVIAVLPLIARALTGITSIALGGTALLIVVSVILDLIKKVDAQLSMHEY